MKRLGLLGLVGLFLSCGQTTHETKKEEAPEESRFVKEVFATNLFEPTELVVLPKGKVIFTQRRGGIKQYDLKKPMSSRIMILFRCIMEKKTASWDRP